MPDYLRALRPGAKFFITVNLLQRQGNNLLTRHIDLLRRVVRDVKRRHPFTIHGWVVLPEHLRCVIELPPDEADFALRWRLIKMDFSKAIPLTERRNALRLKRGERGVWLRRYWEHQIRDEADFRAHMDYLHINPLKYGLVKCVADWPHSSFHRLVRTGVYPEDWAGVYEDNARHLAERSVVQDRIESGAVPCGYCSLRAWEDA